MKEKSVHITYLSDGWSLNTGNAFLDLGSIQSLKMARPNAVVHFASLTPRWFFQINKKNTNNCFDLVEFIKSDYLVVSGMILSDEFINFHGPIISKLIKKGIKLIINGGGGLRYSEKELQSVGHFLEDNPPLAFISRDEQSFEHFKDLAKFSHNGLDCGFFVSNYLTPPKLDLPDYVILNFDEHNLKRFIKSEVGSFSEKQALVRDLEDKGILIISTHHIFWPKVTVRIRDIVANSCGSLRLLRKVFPSVINLNLPNEYFDKPNTLVSAFPDEYLSLYANTKATYSDRVHACVATMSFGNPAMLFSKSKRVFLFDRIGANTITTSITCPNMNTIEHEKSKQVEFLSEVLV